MRTKLDLWDKIVPLIATCSSGVASTFLLCRLQRLAATQRKRMLVRQLMHLAAANLLYSISEAGLLSTGIAIWIDPEMGNDYAPNAICVLTVAVENVGTYVTLMIECHMAVAFATSIYGSSKTMHTMYALLVYIWPVSLLLSPLDTWSVDVGWSTDEGGCYGERKDYMFGVLSTIGFLVCFSSYIISSAVVGRAGRAVQRSVWSRAKLYPAVALVTLGPITIYYFIRSLLSQNAKELVYLVANFLYDATGLLNFLVYAFQSKYVGRRLREGQGAEREASFRVNFCRNDSVVEADATPQQSQMCSDATATDSLLIAYYEGLNGESARLSGFSAHSGDES